MSPVEQLRVEQHSFVPLSRSAPSHRVRDQDALRQARQLPRKQPRPPRRHPRRRQSHLPPPPSLSGTAAASCRRLSAKSREVGSGKTAPEERGRREAVQGVEPAHAHGERRGLRRRGCRTGQLTCRRRRSEAGEELDGSEGKGVALSRWQPWPRSGGGCVQTRRRRGRPRRVERLELEGFQCGRGENTTWN